MSSKVPHPNREVAQETAGSWAFKAKQRLIIAESFVEAGLLVCVVGIFCSLNSSPKAPDNSVKPPSP